MSHLSLYFHIPFCRRRCHYCDFTTFAGKEALIPHYLQALVREVELWGKALAAREGQVAIDTIYFGGGTPSLLSAEEVGQALRACRQGFCLAQDVEISLEANPGTVSLDELEGMRRQGINRLSLGVQSFNHDLLRAMGRLHDATQARQALSWARAAGFDNLNLDLIYGLPEQTLRQWQADLEEALSLSPEHLSLYGLTIEEATPWGRAVAEGRMALPDADLAADMYLWAEARLGTAGYEHYEISNWARPGQECRHNLVYWQRRPYLGLGVAAHSLLGQYRFNNGDDLESYIGAISRESSSPPPLSELAGWGAVTNVEGLSEAEELAETLILRLRLGQGVDMAELLPRWGDQVGNLKETFEELTNWNLLERAGCWLRLTGRGRLLSNEVFWRLLPRSPDR